MPHEPTRRVISRSSVKNSEGNENTLIESKTTTKQSDEQIKIQEKSTASKPSGIDLTNYVNKNPYNEDLELEETNIDQNYIWKDQVTDNFRNLLDNIKKLQQEPLQVDKNEIKSFYKKGLLICATLKKLNRVSHLRINKERVKTNEEKNKVDEHHLELQNLLYEKSHIQKEINKCLEFRSLDEDINLISVEEFYKNTSIDTSRVDIIKNDPHKLKLARLDWELNERQNMKSKIKSLESSIENYNHEIKNKREELDSLHPKLTKILDACKPTLDYLNTKFDDESNISISVQLLPKPLYTLYMMMLSYRDTIDKTVKIEVIGDIEAAKRFDCNDQLNIDDEDSGDSGAEDNENENENYKQKNKSKSKNKNSSNKKDKLFTVYPLNVKLTLTVKKYGQIILNLFYLNILKIITVKPDLVFEKDISQIDSGLLRPENIFNCLYPNDYGIESPNLSNKFIFSALGVKSIEPYIKNIGYPYKWCQILCGLYYLNEADIKNKINNKDEDENLEVKSKEKQCDINGSIENGIKNTNGVVEEMDDDEDDFDNNTNDIFTYAATSSNKNEAKILQKILLKLKSRFKSRVILQESVNLLRKGIIPTSNETPIIRQITSKLTSFKESNYEKFSSSNYTDHLIKSNLINENDCLFYEMVLTNGNAKLNAQLVINQDYPNISPLFAININWKHERSFKDDESIRDIEREINICKDNYIEYDEENVKKIKTTFGSNRNYELLIKQINHLVICFDIYLESESYYLKNDEYPRYKFFLNSVRGKDRKRPYSYLKSHDMFFQRLNYDKLNEDKI